MKPAKDGAPGPSQANGGHEWATRQHGLKSAQLFVVAENPVLRPMAERLL